MKQVSNLRADVIRMPNFNQTIEVKFEVDDIYKMLKDTFPTDYKHREVLSHAVIGTALQNGSLSYIFKALSGFTNDIDFEEGDMVVCSSESRQEWYDANKEDENGTPKEGWIPDEGEPNYKPLWKRRGVAIGACKVVGINLYSEYKLLVEYAGADRYDPAKTQVLREWVSHQQCNKIPVEDKW